MEHHSYLHAVLLVPLLLASIASVVLLYRITFAGRTTFNRRTPAMTIVVRGGTLYKRTRRIILIPMP